MAYKAKTTTTEVDADAFLDSVEHPVRREDGKTLAALMRQVTGKEPRMWGATLVGFGSYRYRYDSGTEGESLKMGFSPRKSSLVLYLPRSEDREDLLARLGKHSTRGGCIYINKLSDVDMGVLKTLLTTAWPGRSFGEIP